MMEIITRQDAIARGLPRYFTGVPCSRGHVAHRRVMSPACIECTTITSRESRRRQRANDPALSMFAEARRRASRDGLEFSIQKSDIVVTDKCPCCNVSMAVSKMNKSRNSPSLDRLDNNIGYVASNITVICWRCNKIKGDATASELHAVANWIESKSRPKLALVS